MIVGPLKLSVVFKGINYLTIYIRGKSNDDACVARCMTSYAIFGGEGGIEKAGERARNFRSW